jgi:hypothetical protein
MEFRQSTGDLKTHSTTEEKSLANQKLLSNLQSGHGRL